MINSRALFLNFVFDTRWSNIECVLVFFLSFVSNSLFLLYFFHYNLFPLYSIPPPPTHKLPVFTFQMKGLVRDSIRLLKVSLSEQ